MVRTALISIVLALELSTPVRAAETPHSVPRPCTPLAKIKADLDPRVKLTVLTAGQFHFVEGVYVGSPETPAGLPPGEGAILAQREGDPGAVVIWTRGALACAPTPINAPLVKLLQTVKTGAGEADDESGDVHL